MVEIGHLLYARFLTNSAGGNISCRVGDRVYITPRGLGSRHRWKLREEMVVVTDLDRNPIEGDPALISREGQMHYACYRHFPEINGVVHAHARYLSVFAAAALPVTPTLQYTRKFGTVEVVADLPAHTAHVAEAVVERLEAQRETLSRNGLGLILAGHGAVTVGRDLADAYDVLDRLEWSAHILLMSRLLDPAQGKR
jgi:L-fuculose-phosphate aldolase